MKVLVIGGMHGNETLGIQLVEMFQSKPQQNVDALLANPVATNENVRFTGKDLNRSFPGESGDGSYEDERAQYLIDVAKNYDVVLDFHNTYCPENDCSFVGEAAATELYNASGFLGLPRVIVADYDCMNKYAPNCLSVEISMNSPRNNPQVWYELIAALARLDSVAFSGDIQAYAFVYRMTLEDKQALRLDEQNLRAFTPVDKDLACALNVPSPAYPIFVADAFTPYNYGGLLTRRE